MSERNRWVPMNRRVTRSGMFGIHKEEVDHITTKLPRSRVFLVIAVLAAIGFLVSLSGLSIYTGKSDINNKMRIFFEQKHRYMTKDNDINNNNNNKDNDNNNNILSSKNVINENEEILIISTSTLIPGTMPTIVQPLSDSDDDNHQETTTVKRFIEQQNNVSLSEQEIASRHSRAYPVEHNSSRTISKVNRSGRIVTRNKYKTSEQSFLYPHPSLQSYSEQYAQLENYKHTTDRMKNVQKVFGITTAGNILPPQTSTVGGSTIKFTGVYVRGPSEHLDGHISDGPIYVNPFLNGHAYTTDPFVKYKPQHPSEINHLAPSTSEIDTGPRFSNKIVRPIKMPQPILEQISSGTGTLTEAIFHPYDTPEDDNKKTRPLKIMLDIYPVVEEPENANQYDRGGTRSNKRSNQMKSGQNNRMIVHLNLYPKKTTKVRKRPSILTSLLPGGGRFEDRKFNNVNETDGDEEMLIEEHGEEMPGMEHFSFNNNTNNNNNKDYVDNDEMVTITTTTTNDNNRGDVSNIGDDLDNNSEHQAVLTFDDVISSIKTFTTNLVANKTHNNNNNNNNNKGRD